MTLRSLRVQHGWTQARLASAIGVTPAYISQVESDKKPLPNARAVQFARLLGYEGDELERVVGALVCSGVEE